jgi:Uma2 family endonuclease
MATTATITPEARGGPRRVRWTRAEFRRMVDAGLTAGRRVELLYGEILDVTPMGRPHMKALNRVRDALIPHLPADGDLYQQVPLAELPTGIRDDSDVYPDAIVAVGAGPNDPLDGPLTALLLVEVAVSSLPYDRDDKRAFYAEAGLPAYWVLDVDHRRVFAYADPRDGVYTIERTYAEGEAVALPWEAGALIPVAALLPPIE